MADDDIQGLPDEEMEQEEELEYPWALSEDELRQAVAEEMKGLLSDSGNDMTSQLRLFNGETPGPEDDSGEEGLARSRIVSTDVADAVEATLAEIMPTFGNEAPVEFAPVGQDDEDQAEIETDAVNHVVMQVCKAYHEFNMAIKDGLIRRLPLLKVYWEERAVPQYDELQNVPIQMLPQVVQPGKEGEEVEVLNWEETAQDVYNLTIRRTNKVSNPVIKAVSRDEFKINSDHASIFYDDARFLCHFRPRSVGELVAEGYDKATLDAAPEYGAEIFAERSKRRRGDVDYETGHSSTKAVLFSESYYLVDMDGDGIAERIKVAGVGFGDNFTVLDWHFVNDQPFVAGALYLSLYDWQSLGLADKLEQIQRGKTETIRQVLDAGERAITGRIAIYPDDWDMDSVLESVMGGVAMKRTREAQADDFTAPDLPRATEILLGLFDRMRKEKGGSAIDTTSQAMQVAGDGAHATERVMSAIEQINAMLARNLAETLIKGAYTKIHKLLRQNWQGPITMKRGDQWINTSPQTQWNQRDDVSLRTGLSISERMRQAQAVGAVIGWQKEMLGLGMDGVLVTPAGIHEALLDFLRLSGVARPAQYFVDPTSQEGQKAAAAKGQAAQQQQAMQQQQLEAQTAVPLQMEDIKGRWSYEREQMKQVMEAQAKTQERFDKMMQHLDNMRLQLAELNAKYDAEEVPDSTKELK